MIIATSNSEKVIHVAKSHGIESKVIGEVVKKPRIIIKSKGAYSKGEELKF